MRYLYTRYLFHTGTADYLCSVDTNLLECIADNWCKEIPLFYPEEFKAHTDALLDENFGMEHADINPDNTKFAYSFLVDTININA